MNTLLANQAIEGAITAILLSVPALIVAVTAYVKAKTTSERQGAQIENLQHQQDKQPVLVAPVTPTTSTAPLPTAMTTDIGMGQAAHLTAAAQSLKQAHDALQHLLVSLPPDPPTAA